MSALKPAVIALICASSSSQALALLTVNIFHDDTTVPGWVINTFTADSDIDLTSAAAFSAPVTGSILNLPGPVPVETFFNGPGDSFVTINGNPNTAANLGAGRTLGGATTPTLSSSLIDLTWYNTNADDIGLGMHLATFSFSEDATGELVMAVGTADGTVLLFHHLITDGFASLSSISTLGTGDPDPNPPPNGSPAPTPTPDPSPPPDPGGDLFPDGNAIPEPVGLGLLGVGVALMGGLHRKRLGVVTG